MKIHYALNPCVFCINEEITANACGVLRNLA